jgi:anti-sigma regulatory factor (Ser/Thr protein kinase)
VVSELATNAMRHADSPFRISLHRTHDAIRIAIEDVAETTPAPRVAASDDAGGRGVAIVERLAHRWGWDRASAGKVVWAELAT